MSEAKNFERLYDAAQALLERRPEETDDEFLARHEELRDVLVAMLAPGSAEADGDPERRLGDFRILRELGRGGMGVVFEAVQESLGRRVALKVLPSHLTQRPETVVRFQREAKTAASLDHEGIIDVYAIDSEGDDHFFAMELVEGAPLDRVLEGLRRVGYETATGRDVGAAVDAESIRPNDAEPRASAASWKRGAVESVLAIGLQVADALAHAHEHGVIHRDIKPSNIIVRPDGSAVLTDFGLAREVGLPSMTVTGDFAGTPYYVSPEQARGASLAIDQRSDVFSLGATLYELLTLARPFDGKTNQEVLARIQTREPRDASRINANLADDVVAILARCLEKDPKHRYPSARELADDLRAFLEYRPIAARRPTARQRLGRWIRREPLKAALAGLLVVGVPVVAALGGYVFQKRLAIATGEESLRHDKIDEELVAATAATFRGHFDEAEAAFERVLAEEAGGLEALAGLAQVTLLRGTGVEFAARLDRLDPRIPGVARIRAWMESPVDYAAAGVEPPATPGEHYIAGLSAFMAGTPPEGSFDRALLARAVRHFTEACILSRRPRLLYLAWRAHAAGHIGDRAHVSATAIALERHYGHSELAYFHAANALTHAGLDAAPVVRRGLARHPRSWTLWRIRGRIAQTSNEFAEAVRAYEALRDLDPTKAHAYIAIAALQRATGKPAEAIATLERARKLAPGDAALSSELASALFDTEQWERAETAARAATRSAPEFSGGWVVLARLLSRKPASEEAELVARKAVALTARKPWDVSARSHLVGTSLAKSCLAFNLARRGAQDEAMRLYGEIVDAIPADPAAWGELRGQLAPLALAAINLGIHCQKQGDLGAAVDCYRRCLSITPEDAEAWMYLAGALEAQGRLEEALAAGKRGHDLGSKRPDWRIPSGAWNADLEARIARRAKRESGALPESAEACVRAAYSALNDRDPARALRLFERAFALDSARVSNPATLLGAAFAAAAAANVAEAERTALRERAVGWLEEVVDSWSEEPSRSAKRRLASCRTRPELSSIRGAAVASLPPALRHRCARVWERIDALLDPERKE